MISSKVLFLLLVTLVNLAFAHGDAKCRHDQIDHNPEFLDIGEEFPTPGDEEARRLALASNIRIYAHFDTLNNVDPSYKSYMQYELLPPVVAYFQGALRVKYPVSGNLKVNSTLSTVCGTPTPSLLFGDGIPADFFIFYTATADSGTWIADSTVCYLSTGTNRPLIANSLLNTNLIGPANGNVLLHEKNMYLVMHEMTHTFGFSYSLYKYFLDSNGVQLSGHITSKTLDGAKSVVINVPVLTNKLRSYFGCSSLAGAYMENSGSTATAGSHFERRQFGFEAMTSGLTYQQRYSEFSLAMLEASGWYSPDYDYAEPFFFGQGQGCNFLTQSCSSSSFSFDDFCSKAGSRDCTPQGRGGGACQTDTRSDNCQFVHANVAYDCQNPDAINNARIPSAETYSRTSNSMCFSGTLSIRSSTSSITSFCFTYSCSGVGSGTIVNVQVGSQTVTCTNQGSMSVPGYKGTINCPDPLTFCQTIGKPYCPRNCMGRGDCYNGACSCYSGFSGIDCALNS